jgi:hypothetical protein
MYNNIIQKTNDTFTNTLPNLYYNGSFNPLDKRIIQNLIVINSQFRDNYYATISSDFIFEFPLDINNIVSLRVTDIQLPEIYNISRYLGNNFFLIKNETTFEVKKIIIPDGNYSNEDIIDYLNNLFTNFTDDFKYIHFAINNQDGETIIGLKDTSPYIYNFTLEFDNDFIETIFSSIDNPTKNSNNLLTKFGWILGFRYSVYEGKSVYISEGLIETQQSNIFLCIDDFNSNKFNSKYNVFNNSTLINNNIVAQIYFNNNDINNLKINTITNTYFGGVQLKKIHIKLIDIFGRIVNLNNNDFSFTLVIEKIYNI